MTTVRSSKVMVTLLMSFLIIGVFPTYAQATTTTSNRLQRIEARKVKQSGTAASRSSEKSTSPSQAFQKPYCGNQSQARWICGEWSACRYSPNGTWNNKNWGPGWSQSRKCKPDATAQCIGRTDGPISQSCSPTAKQQQAIDEQQAAIQKKADQQAQAVLLTKFKESVQSVYQSAEKTQNNMDSLLPYHSGTTSMQLFQLSTQHADKLTQLKVYNDKAKAGLLQLSDFPAYERIATAMSDISKRFISIAKEAQSIPKSSPVYVVPVVPRSYQPTKSHQQMCDELRVSLALQGAFGAGAEIVMKNAGC